MLGVRALTTVNLFIQAVVITGSAQGYSCVRERKKAKKEQEKKKKIHIVVFRFCLATSFFLFNCWLAGWLDYSVASYSCVYEFAWKKGSREGSSLLN